MYNDQLRLHYWQTPNNAQNGLVRGTAEDQEAAVRDLYALLVHTTSTHAPQEYNTVPWSIPSAKTIELLRNMVIREYKGDLVLFSALSPGWFEPGRKIEAMRAPSEFGPLDVVLSVGPSAESWQVELPRAYRNAPRRVLIRIPWFYEVRQVIADGRRVQGTDGVVAVRPGVAKVEITGSVKPGIVRLDYEQAVREYKREYRERYEEFLRTGLIRP